MKLTKKWMALFLAMVMTSGLAACGGKTGIADSAGDNDADNPALGKYIGLEVCAYGNEWTPIGEIYDLGENYIELKTGGEGVLTLDGDPNNVKWELKDDGALTMTRDGATCKGTLKDDMITLETYFDYTLGLTFLREGVEPPAKPADTDAEPDAAAEPDDTAEPDGTEASAEESDIDTATLPEGYPFERTTTNGKGEYGMSNAQATGRATLATMQKVRKDLWDMSSAKTRDLTYEDIKAMLGGEDGIPHTGMEEKFWNAEKHTYGWYENDDYYALGFNVKDGNEYYSNAFYSSSVKVE